MPSFVRSAAVLIALFGLAAPASATVITVTYSGTIVSGTDQAGLFGTAGADLSGQKYSARYVFNTKLGTQESSAALNRLFGGNAFGTTSPAVYTTLTIGGHSIDLNDFSNGELNYRRDGGRTIIDASDTVIGNSLSSAVITYQISNVVQIYAGYFLPGFADQFKYDTGPDDTTSGTVSISSYDPTAQTSSVDTTVSTVLDTVTVTTAVPEPSTWALMVAGFFGLSALHRRRERLRRVPSSA